MPQKQPPDRTAVCRPPLAALAASNVGAGSARGASSARAQAQATTDAPSAKAAERTRGLRNFNIERLHLPKGSDLRARHEFERGRIHAIAQAGRLRSVIEHVTEMAIATLTGNRRPA